MKGFTKNVPMVNATRFRNRVDRVLGFPPVVRIGTPPPPSPAGECVSLLWCRGGHTLAGEGGPNSDDETDTVWYSRYRCTLYRPYNCTVVSGKMVTHKHFSLNMHKILTKGHVKIRSRLK